MFRAAIAASADDRFLKNTSSDRTDMRAETQDIISDIKQAVSLLRRHL